MLGQIMDAISFPVVQLLLMLKDERITAYLGVSVLGIAVTCMITMIVFRALVSTVNAGDLAASGLNARDVKEASARDRAHRESYEYYEAHRERREKYARIYKNRHSGK